MALLPCQGCGNQVDASAPICPKCGRPRPTTSTWRKLAMPAVLVIGLIVFMERCWEAAKRVQQRPPSQTAFAIPQPSAVPAGTPVQASSGPTTQRISFAGFDGDLLEECNDVELPRVVRLPDGGSHDPAQGLQEFLQKGALKGSLVKLNKPCAEQFRDRPPLATCAFEGSNPILPMRGQISHYSYKRIFESDAMMKECLSTWKGTWEVIPKDSDAFHRAEIEHNLRRLEENQAKARKLLDKSMRQLRNE